MTDTEKKRKLIINVAFYAVLLVLGFFGFIVIVSQIGFVNLVFMSGASRGASASVGGSGTILAYAKILAKLLIASLAPGIILVETRKSWGMKVLLVIIFMLSLMLEIFMAGKSNFIILSFFCRCIKF